MLLQVDMPRIRRRIANELANLSLSIEPEIQMECELGGNEDDELFAKQMVQTVTLDDSEQSAAEPEMQPFQLDDSKNSPDIEPKMLPSDNATFEDSFNCKITWDDLNQQCANKTYTYVIEKYEDLTQQTFSGAPEECFNVEFRVNLCTEQDFNEWMTAFSQSSQCTYRKTRTYNPSLKRVLFKLDML